MQIRLGPLALLAVVAFVWWLLTPSQRAVAPVAASAGRSVVADASRCPLPPIVEAGEAPLQSAIQPGIALPDVDGARLTSLAGFSVRARVLSRERYHFGREADYSPLDLALGWGRMQDAAVLSKLRISQGGRWYHLRWSSEPPLPAGEMLESSSNMHMVPADDAIASALERVRQGQFVRIDGWLVEIDATDGWKWRSSLSRHDTGGGACELVYVCAVTTY